MLGDPGYRMEPVGMEKINQKQWVKKFDGFELHTETIRGMTGESWIDPNLAISTGQMAVTIESIELQTSKGHFPAKVRDELRVIPALSSEIMLHASWRFQENTRAPEILGESVQIVIHLKVGDLEQTPEMEYRRVSCCL
jgi:hypothetical protein